MFGQTKRPSTPVQLPPSRVSRLDLPGRPGSHPHLHGPCQLEKVIADLTKRSKRTRLRYFSDGLTSSVSQTGVSKVDPIMTTTLCPNPSEFSHVRTPRLRLTACPSNLDAKPPKNLRGIFFWNNDGYGFTASLRRPKNRNHRLEIAPDSVLDQAWLTQPRRRLERVLRERR